MSNINKRKVNDTYYPFNTDIGSFHLSGSTHNFVYCKIIDEINLTTFKTQKRVCTQKSIQDDISEDSNLHQETTAGIDAEAVFSHLFSLL